MANPDTRTRQLPAALAAVAVHFAVAALAWWLPEPPPPEPPQEWARTEVVLLDADLFDVEVASETPANEATEDAVPNASAAQPSDPVERPPRELPGTPRARSGNGEQATAPSPEAATEPAAPGTGLSLSGLRGSSRARPTPGVPRPTVTVPTRPPSETAPAPLGPSRPRSTSSNDRTPRSLAEAGFKRRKDGSYRYRERGVPFKATIHPNGRIEFSLKGTSAHRLGMADVMRSAGGEELFGAAKKRLLAETLELRMRLAQSWAREQMRAQLQDLQRQLLATWKRSEWSTPRRRKELFTLWDDCEESLSVDRSEVDRKLASSIDSARAQAGKRARAKIVAFINQHLPHDSTHAYTAAEIRSFNASRRSKGRFAPYAASTKAPARPADGVRGTVPPAPEPPSSVTPPDAG